MKKPRGPYKNIDIGNYLVEVAKNCCKKIVCTISNDWSAGGSLISAGPLFRVIRKKNGGGGIETKWRRNVFCLLDFA